MNLIIKIFEYLITLPLNRFIGRVAIGAPLNLICNLYKSGIGAVTEDTNSPLGFANHDFRSRLIEL